MAVEKQREDEGCDRFPVGMRVLAVDDDPICLKVLENLLRKCQYHGSLLLISFWLSKNLFVPNLGPCL